MNTCEQRTQQIFYANLIVNADNIGIMIILGITFPTTWKR